MTQMTFSLLNQVKVREIRLSTTLHQSKIDSDLVSGIWILGALYIMKDI